MSTLVADDGDSSKAQCEMFSRPLQAQDTAPPFYPMGSRAHDHAHVPRKHSTQPLGEPGMKRPWFLHTLGAPLPPVTLRAPPPRARITEGGELRRGQL